MTKQGRTWVLRPRGPIHEGVRKELAARLLRHVRRRWTGRVRRILLRFHGAYAYVAVVETARGEKVEPRVCRYIEEGEVPLQLCRLGYVASIDQWAYSFFKYSDGRYEPSVVASGSFLATPEQAFDCAAGVYLHG